MHFGYYFFYVFTFVVMLKLVDCVSEEHGEEMHQYLSNETEFIRPNLSHVYCKKKFSCDLNQTTSCYCDSLCEVMGDCCKDFVKNRTLDNQMEKSQFSCFRMLKLSTDNVFGALIVAACPRNWTDGESRSLCENRKKIVRLDDTYINKDGIVFKNLFCAFCNSALTNSYRLDKIKICANNDHRDGECNELYDKRAAIHSMRLCPLNIIDTCPSGTEDDLSDNCTKGEYGTVYDLPGNMYRNTYCGICHNVLIENLSCEKDKVAVGDPYAFPDLFQDEETRFTPDIKLGESLSTETNETQRKRSNQSSPAQMYLTVVLLIISEIALIITLVIYKCFPVLLNTPGKITCCLALSLLFAQFLFLISSETEPIPELCKTIAVLVHYFFLAAFCWMNVIAFDLWMTFANHIFDCDEKRKFCYYNVYAWIAPFLIVTMSVCFNFSETVGSFNPRYGKTSCWIFSENAKILFFIAPLALSKLFDIVAFSCTVYYIRKSKRESSFARKGESGKGKGNTCLFFINLKLSLIMGLTWTFAFLAKYSDNEALWYMFTFFNALQGLFIFVCFVCNKRVYRLVKRLFRCGDASASNSSNVGPSSKTKSTSI